MPRYFFNVHHERSSIDTEGEELPDKHAAWRQATIVAGETIRDIEGRLQPGREWRLEVTDEFANPLYIIHLSAEQPKIVLKEHQMTDNKEPNEKKPGEKPEGKYHYNPGNQSGKEAKIVSKEEAKKDD
jgi:hypothetical protein